MSVPVDDQWHTRTLQGPIVHVATRHVSEVELWFVHDPAIEPADRRLRVVGTGHPMLGRYVGTALAPGGQLVWHLVER